MVASVIHARWVWPVVLVVACVLGGCAGPRGAGDADPVLERELDAVPQVDFLGPGNPTLSPEVLAKYWNSSMAQSATPLQVAPGEVRPAAVAPSSPPGAGPDRDPTPDPASVLFPQAAVVRSPVAPRSTPAGTTLVGAAAEISGPAGPGAAAAVYRGAGAVAGFEQTVGRLLFTMDGRPRACTATVVASQSLRVAVTAGHCVLTEGSAGERKAAANMVFAPGYRAGQFPRGLWRVASAHPSAEWQRSADFAHDVAFLRLDRLDGLELAQEVLGGQGLVFADPGAGGAVALLGYPSLPPFDGASLRWCTSAVAGPPDPAEPVGVSMPCAMTHGYSGGPLLGGFDPLVGDGFVRGVASYDRGGGVIYAARLDASALAAFREADRG